MPVPKPMHTVPRGCAPQPDDDDDLGTARPMPSLIPDGDYAGVCMRVEKGRFARRERIFLWFEISTPGDDLKKQLFLSCPCPDGGTVFGLGSKLVAAYAVATGHLPGRRDRITKSVFIGKMFWFRTRTVKKDKDGKARHTSDCYSVIDQLLTVETT